MQAVIMAGGVGMRLRPLTANVPKPMVPLFDRPVMEHILNLLAKHGITDVIVTLSHLTGEIAEYFGDGSSLGVKIRYSIETDPYGTAGGVKLVQDMIDGTFVVISGDVVTDFDLTEALYKHRSASAIATIMLSDVDDPTQFGAVQCDPNGKVMRFLEKPKSSDVFGKTVSAGIYVLEPEVLSCIPYNWPFDFGRDLFPRMLNNGEPVYGFPIPGYWCDIGNVNHYRKVHFDALEGKLKIDLPAAHIGQGIWIGERVDLHSSVEISAPVFLGPGAIIRRGAILENHTVVGTEALINEGARISHSVIGSRSCVGRNAVVTNCITSGGYSISDSETVNEQLLITSPYYEKPTAIPFSNSTAQSSNVDAQQPEQTAVRPVT